MAGVRLEFAQFGHFEYFNIYRNETSKSVENLGSPISTCSTGYYEDFGIEPNTDYYYRVGVVRDGSEIFSEEIYVRTEIEFNPPYNIQVAWNNADQAINLTWDLDSSVDEQRYYCSETPINTDSLPTPKSTLPGDVRSYTDTVIDAGKTYYVCIGSVKNGVEKFSNEIEVLALTEYANTFLKLKSDVVDAGLHPKTFTNNGVTFTNSAAVFTGSQHIASNTKSPDFNFGTGDFTIELAMSLPASGGGYVLDSRNLYGNAGTLVTSDYANLIVANLAAVSWSNGSVLCTASYSFTVGQLYAIAITRASGLLRIFIDGVKLLEVYDTTNIAGDRYAHIGVGRLQDGSYEGWFKGSLKKLRVTKGIAKYVADYQVTYQK